jgi:hypothetical protein
LYLPSCELRAFENVVLRSNNYFEFDRPLDERVAISCHRRVQASATAAARRAPATLKLQLRSVGWLVIIWALSVMALGVVAGLFRGSMTLAGLTL